MFGLAVGSRPTFFGEKAVASAMIKSLLCDLVVK
jgi:hypothetical protein